MTKKFVAVLEISENDPYINDLGDLKEEIEKLLYLPGCVVSIKPLPQKKGITESMILNQHYQDLVNYHGGYNACLDEIAGERE